MKTKITTTIDGQKIIVGIGDVMGLIDPENTKLKSVAALRDTDEFKAITKKIEEYSGYQQESLAANSEFHNAVKKYGTAAKIPVSVQTEINAKYQRAHENMRSCQEQLRNMNTECDKKFVELMQLKENIVYFTPRQEETIIENDEAEKIKVALKNAQANKKYLRDDMTEITDYRGTVFFKKDGNMWSWRQITTLCDAPIAGEKLESELTEKELEKIKLQIRKNAVKDLSAIEKTAAKEKEVFALKIQASDMARGFEISGDTPEQATAKAKEWYNEQILILDEIYA